MLKSNALFARARTVWHFLAESVAATFILEFLSKKSSTVLGAVFGDHLRQENLEILLSVIQGVVVSPVWALLWVVTFGSWRGLAGAASWLLFADVANFLLARHGSEAFLRAEPPQFLVLRAVSFVASLMVGYVAVQRLRPGLKKRPPGHWALRWVAAPTAFACGLGYVLIWEVDVGGNMSEAFQAAMLVGDVELQERIGAGTSTGRVLRNGIIALLLRLTGRVGRTLFCGDPGVVLGSLIFFAYVFCFRTALVGARLRRAPLALLLAGLITLFGWALTSDGARRMGALISPCGEFMLKDRAAVSACLVATWRREDPTLLRVMTRGSSWRLFYSILVIVGAVPLVLGPVFPARGKALPQNVSHLPETNNDKVRPH